MVQYLNGWSNTKDTAHRPTIWNQNLKQFGIQMVGIQISIVNYKVTKNV